MLESIKESHKDIISKFGEVFIKEGIFPKEMERELNRAFEKRQLSDYEHIFMISEEEAKEILLNGKEFVEKIIQYLIDIDELKNNSFKD